VLISADRGGDRIKVLRLGTEIYSWREGTDKGAKWELPPATDERDLVVPSVDYVFRAAPCRDHGKKYNSGTIDGRRFVGYECHDEGDGSRRIVYLAPDLGMRAGEARTQFTMWAVVAAPLMLGNDVRRMSDSTRWTVTNREVIAIDQDPLGVQGHRIAARQRGDVWVKRLADGSVAVALLNHGSRTLRISTTARAIGLPRARRYTAHNRRGAHRRPTPARRCWLYPFGVISPNRPSASWLMPAVKNSAFGPAPGVAGANRSPHSPSMVIGPPTALLS